MAVTIISVEISSEASEGPYLSHAQVDASVGEASYASPRISQLSALIAFCDMSTRMLLKGNIHRAEDTHML